MGAEQIESKDSTREQQSKVTPFLSDEMDSGPTLASTLKTSPFMFPNTFTLRGVWMTFKSRPSAVMPTTGAGRPPVDVQDGISGRPRTCGVT